jgi:hypothetical protein
VLSKGSSCTSIRWQQRTAAAAQEPECSARQPPLPPPDPAAAAADPPKVLASVFGPREVATRSDLQQDRAIIKCEYAMAAFSTGVGFGGCGCAVTRADVPAGRRWLAELNLGVALAPAAAAVPRPDAVASLCVCVLQAHGGSEARWTAAPQSCPRCGRGGQHTHVLGHDTGS